jgi:antitoxin component of MazEF toxin-antitoxin module
MLYMERLRVRRVGNSLGVLFPKELVARKDLRLDDDVLVEVEKPPSIESVIGALRYLGMTVDEMNDLTNEGEDI